MSGRITSKDLSVNEYGVPYSRVLELERQANRRHAQALAEALRLWVDLEWARRDGSPETERLHREALKLTERALG